jgi:hypothetical protein
LEIVALLSWRDGDPLELAVVGSAVAAIAAVIAGVFALKPAGAGERRRLQLSLTLGVALIAFWVLLYSSVYGLGTE